MGLYLHSEKPRLKYTILFWGRSHELLLDVPDLEFMGNPDEAFTASYEDRVVAVHVTPGAGQIHCQREMPAQIRSLTPTVADETISARQQSLASVKSVLTSDDDSFTRRQRGSAKTARPRCETWDSEDGAPSAPLAWLASVDGGGTGRSISALFNTGAVVVQGCARLLLLIFLKFV